MAATTGTYQKLIQGLSFKKNKAKAEEETQAMKVENYTVNKDTFEISEIDQELFNDPLKFINTHQILNSHDVLSDRSEAECKAIHRKREALGKFLKQNNMKVIGDHVPLPVVDFKDFLK
jgi:hypothetical protein